MKYLLDTNTCIRFLNKRVHRVEQRMRESEKRGIALCDIVKAELYFGVENSARVERNLVALE